jgi:ribosomal protein L11 methyltransferase
LGKYPAIDLGFRPGACSPILEELLYATLDDFDPLGIHLEDASNAWRVFFPSPTMRDHAAEVLAAKYATDLSVRPVDVADDGWARRSQADLRAVRIGRIVVAPPWDVPLSGGGEIDRGAGGRARGPELVTIVIEPSMGFGTGHHPTTRLCLALMQSLPLGGQRMIDVGTGSGVLAIAGWKLGASTVIALDHDADAVQSARENVVRNAAKLAVEVREASVATVALEPADIVTANLTGTIIERHALALRRLVLPGGWLIVSGFGLDELPDVSAAIGATPKQKLVEGDWMAALVSR